MGRLSLVRTVSRGMVGDAWAAWRARRLKKQVEKLEDFAEYLARSLHAYRRQAEIKRCELANWQR